MRLFKRRYEECKSGRSSSLSYDSGISPPSTKTPRPPTRPKWTTPQEKPSSAIEEMALKTAEDKGTIDKGNWTVKRVVKALITIGRSERQI